MVLHPVLNPLRSCCLNHWQGHMYADTQKTFLTCRAVTNGLFFFFFLHTTKIFFPAINDICVPVIFPLCAASRQTTSDASLTLDLLHVNDDLFMPQSDRQLHSSALLGVSTYFWTLPFQIFHMWFFQHWHKYTLIKAETWHFIIDFLKLDALTKTVWFCISACDLFFFSFHSADCLLMFWPIAASVAFCNLLASSRCVCCFEVQTITACQFIQRLTLCFFTKRKDEIQLRNCTVGEVPLFFQKSNVSPAFVDAT